MHKVFFLADLLKLSHFTIILTSRFRKSGELKFKTFLRLIPIVVFIVMMLPEKLLSKRHHLPQSSVARFFSPPEYTRMLSTTSLATQIALGINDPIETMPICPLCTVAYPKKQKMGV